MDITTSGTWQQGYGFANLSYGFDRSFSRDQHTGRYYITGVYTSDYGTLTFGNTPIVSTSEFDQPGFIAAFDSTGNNLWAKQTDSPVPECLTGQP